MCITTKNNKAREEEEKGKMCIGEEVVDGGWMPVDGGYITSATHGRALVHIWIYRAVLGHEGTGS